MLNNSNVHTLSSTHQDSTKSETSPTGVAFTKPTFTKPDLKVKIAGSEHSIGEIIAGDVSLPKGSIMLTFPQFIEFYKGLTTNIESLNSDIALNINDEIVNPLTNSISNIKTLTSNVGGIEQSLIEQINQIKENMVISLE